MSDHESVIDHPDVLMGSMRQRLLMLQHKQSQQDTIIPLDPAIPILPFPLRAGSEQRAMLHWNALQPLPTCLLGFLSLFFFVRHLAARQLQSPKRTAWILTLVSAPLVTLLSTPFVLDFVTARGQVCQLGLGSPGGDRTMLGQWICW